MTTFQKRVVIVVAIYIGIGVITASWFSAGASKWYDVNSSMFVRWMLLWPQVLWTWIKIVVLGL